VFDFAAEHVFDAADFVVRIAGLGRLNLNDGGRRELTVGASTKPSL
jgi:hypothetical protein